VPILRKQDAFQAEEPSNKSQGKIIFFCIMQGEFPGQNG